MRQTGGVTEIRLAQPEDAAEVGRLLAAGFAEDPVMRWVFRGPEVASTLGVFFSFLAAEAQVPAGATHLTDGACACWAPPDPAPWSAEMLARFGSVLGPACGPGDLDRLTVLSALTDAHHPTESHWYLGLLATLPARRGRGVGAALLAHGLAGVDQAGLPAYLESTNPRNLTLYQRHGFEITGRIDLPDGPHLTTMWRPAPPPS
ncbi:GNAT family N-acetyltransferase [soil metagenome]